MGNCLVTKLGAVVNNDALLPLGKIRMTFAISAANTDVLMPALKVNEATILTITGNATWKADQSHITYIDETYKQIKLQANHTYTSAIRATTGNVSSGSFTVDIENKYALTTFSSNGNGGPWDLEIFEYSTDLTTLGGTAQTDLGGNIIYLSGLTALENILVSASSVTDALQGDISVFANMPDLKVVTLQRNSALYGDISAFSAATDLEDLNFRYCTKIYGNIETLGSLTSLEYLRLQNTHASGNLNTLLDDLHTAGKESGTLTVICPGSDIDYTGTKNVKEEGIVFTFSENGWTENE